MYINSAGTSEPVDEQPTEVKLKKVFGKKAAEMAKFHRILMAAEENMSSLAEPSLSAPPAKEEPTDSVNNVADRKDPNSGSVSPTEDKGKRLPSRRRKSSVTAERAREKSANATVVRMSEVLFGFLWQVAVTNEQINVLSVIGSILIASGVMIIVIFKQPDNKEIQSKNKNS